MKRVRKRRLEGEREEKYEKKVGAVDEGRM
jgi:hypothetical protein